MVYFVVYKDHLIFIALDQLNLADFHFNHCIYNQNPDKFQVKIAKLYTFCTLLRQMSQQSKLKLKFIFYATPPLPLKEFMQYR